MRLFALPVSIPILAALSFVYFEQGYSLIDQEQYSSIKREVSFADLKTGWCHAARKGERNLPFTETLANCARGSQARGAKQALLWGDSHAGHFGPFLDHLGQKFRFSITDRSTPGCMPFLDSKSAGISPEICTRYRLDIKKNIDQYDLAFVAGRWDYFTFPKHFDQLDQSMAFLNANVESVYIFLQIPVFEQNIGECYLRGKVFGFSGCSATDHFQLDTTYQLANARIKEVAKKYPRVKIIDVGGVICNHSKCHPFREELPLYHDDDHLSIFGAVALAKSHSWLEL